MKHKKEGPSQRLSRLADKICRTDEHRAEFLDFVMNARAKVPALVWVKPRPQTNPFKPLEPLAEQPDCMDRVDVSAKAGRHPMHDEGFYYCLDYASVMMAIPMVQISQNVDFVVDMCASPGGKSVLAHALLHPKKILSNEVIGKRLPQLKSNLIRCGVPFELSNKDPELVADDCADLADLVIVDAPCSGQSLLAKGEEAQGCFNPAIVNKCLVRQRRIIANSAKTVKSGGHLIYCTCTYSPEENEEIIEWFLAKFPDFKTVAVDSLKDWQSHLTTEKCYRFYPSKERGAGGFTCLLQRKSN